MKAGSPQEPLYTFTYPKLGYSIQIVPHTSADRAKIKRDAKSWHVSLRDYCQTKSSAGWCWPNSSDATRLKGGQMYRIT